MKINQIYLAGPLFTEAEQDFNKKIADKLITKGYKVFLPWEECMNMEGSDIFNTCKKGIDESDVVLAVVDGADADSGTCWESGYAYQKKPIIALRTDFRVSGDTKGFNAMIYYSANEIVEKIGQDYFPKIIKALDKLKIEDTSLYPQL